MSIPRIVGTDFGGPEDGRLLLLGPSLGTSAATLWTGAAERLREHIRVVAWDLPGHGRSGVTEPFTMAELAEAINTAEQAVRAGVPIAKLVYIEPDIRRSTADTSSG